LIDDLYMDNNRILCIGSAVLDITAGKINKNTQWKEKQRIDSIIFSVGGDALNQSVRLADAGADVQLVSAVGNDKNADIIRSELIRRKVNTDRLIVKEDFPTGTSLILLDEKGDRTIFSVKGAYCELTTGDIKNILDNRVRAVSIASLFTEPNIEKDGSLLKLLKEAKRRKTPVFADLANDKLGLGINGIKDFLPYIDYFLPSLFDARLMNNEDSAETNARIYRNFGCKNVIIKCGDRGVYILSDEYEGWINAINVNPVDTTGAGDCMVALFIYKILENDNIYDAARFACDGATYSVLFKGASAGFIDEISVNKWKQSIKENNFNSL
jgi:sugar/nucleoside kinase (ribokinase family)